MSVEKEIETGIRKFIDYIKNNKGFDISLLLSGDDITKCMQQINDSRRFNLTTDNFLYMCEYLTLSEIIMLSTLSHTFIDNYYPKIWGLIQMRKFPESIIGIDEYIDIRQAMSLDAFYYYLLQGKQRNNDWYDLYNDFKDREMHCYEHDEFVEYFNEIDEEITKDFIKTFQFNSVTLKDGTKSYTIKPEIDCRLYGLDPIKDSMKSDIKRKWVTGEHNDESDYDFDSSDEFYSDFCTNNEYCYIRGDRRSANRDGRRSVRYRIRPSYC